MQCIVNIVIFFSWGTPFSLRCRVRGVALSCPVRAIVGPVAVRCPRVRDRASEGSERIRFSSAILPPYARRSKSLEVLIPILYLKGVSTGQFGDALAALLGPDAGGLSASTVNAGEILHRFAGEKVQQ